MKRTIVLLSLLVSSTIFTGCPVSPATPTASDTPAATVEPTAAPTAAPTNRPTDLNSLRVGVLPDTSFTDAERKLAGVLIRQTTPVFPLKIGVLLYREPGAISESDRRANFDNFLQKLRENPDVGQVIEISSNLIARGADIEEIRKLGARFQVSSVLVISENYQFPEENKEALVTPIDLITGTRTWESYSNIEVYGLDILNGVFLFSTASGVKESDKYNRNSSTIKNPDNILIRNSAMKTWKGLEDKVSKEISDYKKNFENNKVVPVVLELPPVQVTASPSTSPQ
jgi:hypothetical protein